MPRATQPGVVGQDLGPESRTLLEDAREVRTAPHASKQHQRDRETGREGEREGAEDGSR